MEDINKNDDVVDTGAEGEGSETEQLPKTMEELRALLQAEGDKRVSQALKKQELKNQKKIAEAKKLAQMDEQARYEYELEQRENAIAEKERELALAENKTEASKILNERGIDISLVDFVVAEDAETMLSNIDLLDKSFKKSVKAEVEKRLAGSTPKKGLQRDTTITKEQFMKMGYSEIAELKRDNPELYDQLVKSR